MWGVVSYCGRSWGGGPTCRHRSFRRVTFYQKPLVLVYEEWHLEGKGGGSVGAGSQGRQTDDPRFLSQNVVVHQTSKPRCRCLWYVNFYNHHFWVVWLMVSAADKPADAVFLNEKYSRGDPHCKFY